MNRNDLINWIERHYLETEWVNNSVVKVRCPFHSTETNICVCKINVDSKVLKCDESEKTEPIEKLFNMFWEEYPTDPLIAQINWNFYTNLEGNPIVTLEETIYKTGKKTYCRFPTQTKCDFPFKIISVLSAIDKDIPIVWVVGEYKVRELEKLGIVATTSLGAGTNYRILPNVVKHIPEAARIILASNGTPTHAKYFQKLTESLLLKGIKPKIIDEKELLNGVKSIFNKEMVEDMYDTARESTSSIPIQKTEKQPHNFFKREKARDYKLYQN